MGSLISKIKQDIKVHIQESRQDDQIVDSKVKRLQTDVDKKIKTLQLMIEDGQEQDQTVQQFIPRLLAVEKKLATKKDDIKYTVTSELKDWAETHHHEIEQIK